MDDHPSVRRTELGLQATLVDGSFVLEYTTPHINESRAEEEDDADLMSASTAVKSPAQSFRLHEQDTG